MDEELGAESLVVLLRRLMTEKAVSKLYSSWVSPRV